MPVRPLLIAIVCAGLLVACGARDPASQIAEARSLLEGGNANGAVVTLKALLQEGADSSEARFLLGQALLAGGDTTSALVELEKAGRQGTPPDRLVPVIARAQVMAGQFDKLIAAHADTRLTNPTAQADLQTSLGTALASIGQLAKARGAIEAALASDPKFTPARVLDARLRAEGGNLAAALGDAQRILADAPNDPEAWLLQGDLRALDKQDKAGILADYRKAAALNPKYTRAHAAVMSVLLAQDGDLDAAKEHLKGMSKALPNDGLTKYFEAAVALRSGELDRAQELVQLLLQWAPEDPRILRLAGLTEATRGANARAASLLAKLMLIQPDDHEARRLLAMTHLRMGQGDRALGALRPLLERTPPDTEALKLAARAELLSGTVAAANRYFTMAAKLDPGDTGSRAALAFGRVRSGDAAGGLAELQALAARDDGTAADLPLITALIDRRDFDAALKAIDGFEKKSPKDPVPALLRAQVLAQSGKRVDARAAYERALSVQPGFFPALNALAEMDLAEGRTAEAQRRYDELLKSEPRHMQALLALANLKARSGAPTKDVVARINEIIQHHPNEVLPRLALVRYLLANKDPVAARQAAQQADATIPDNLDIVDALGQAQTASGDTQQSVQTYGRLIQLRPNLVEPYLRLAEAQWAGGSRNESIDAIKRALLVDADSPKANRALFNAFVAMNRTDEARAVTRDIQKRRPDDDTGYLLEGLLPASNRKWDQALQVYRKGLQAVPGSPALAERLHFVLTTLKQDQEAAHHAEAWLAANPTDAEFATYLADFALTQKNNRLAESRYREAIRRQPDSPRALNNLAWLLTQRNEAEGLALAERANLLEPNRAPLMDTLALALASQGQVSRGIEILRKALVLEPHNPNLRLNLARLLVKAGDKSAAKTELNVLAGLGSKFPQQGEVAELLKGL